MSLSSRGLRQSPSHIRQYARQSGKPDFPSRSARSKKRYYAAGSVLVASAGLYTFSETVRDDVQFTAHIIQRSATVAVTLGRCVWHYRRTLNANYNNEEEREQALSACHTKCAKSTREASERNAGIFIKLGQHISALTYVFPDEWTTAMLPSQDRCPISSFDDIQDLFIQDTGKPIEDIFQWFDPKPMGTASSAQVHQAQSKDGQGVAVKVQHPELQRYIPLDSRLTETVFKLVDYFFPEYPSLWSSDEMRRSIFVESDFVQEARNAETTAKYFKNFYDKTALRIPTIYWAQRRILCMEFLPGIRPDNRVELEKNNIDLKDLSLCFAHLFNNMIFTPGVGLHCDPHAGNIAIRPCSKNKHGFEVILYDHGLYRYVETGIREAYAHFWLSMMNLDVNEMRKYAHDFAGIDDDDFQIFAAAITGRDFDSSCDGSVFEKPRSKEEVERMQEALKTNTGSTSQIMQMLHKMPPAVLLILKTNDLVRYIDEQLGSPLGITREFIIMAKYCSATVFSEERQERFGFFKAWFHYCCTQFRILALQLYMVV